MGARWGERLSSSRAAPAAHTGVKGTTHAVTQNRFQRSHPPRVPRSTAPRMQRSVPTPPPQRCGRPSNASLVSDMALCWTRSVPGRAPPRPRPSAAAPRASTGAPSPMAAGRRGTGAARSRRPPPKGKAHGTLVQTGPDGRDRVGSRGGERLSLARPRERAERVTSRVQRAVCTVHCTQAHPCTRTATRQRQKEGTLAVRLQAPPSLRPL